MNEIHFRENDDNEAVYRPQLAAEEVSGVL
jgi:hypothetical protein